MDLIDEMIITRVSIILGGGIPLFGNLDNQITFKVLETVITSYSIHYTKLYEFILEPIVQGIFFLGTNQ